MFGAKAADAKTLSLDHAAFVGGTHAGKSAAVTRMMHRFWTHRAPRGRVWSAWLVGLSWRRGGVTTRLFGSISGSNTDWWFGSWPLQVWIFQDITGSLSNGDLPLGEAQELFKGKFWQLIGLEVNGFCLAHLLGPIDS